MGYIFFKSQSIETLFITFFFKLLFSQNLNLYVNIYCLDRYFHFINSDNQNILYRVI